MKKPAKDTSIRVAAGKNVRKPKRTPRQASGKRIRLKKSRDKAAPDAVVAPEEPRAKTPSSDEALLAEAQALAHLGSWAWDIAADVVSWSDELYRIMGLEPQQCPVTYQVFLKCVHPEDRDCIHRVVQQSLSDHQPFSFDYRVILPSKAVRIQHGKGAVITDDRGRAARMHGTAQDITEQKQAAEDLRHSEQRFAAFMDNLPGFAWMKDVKGRFVYRNKAMREIPGFRENWNGKSDADFWPPEVAAQYRASDLKVIASRAPLQTVAPYPGDNRDRYVLVSKFPIFDQAGAVTMVAGVSVEVTERIQAEQARAQLAAIVESSNDAIIGQTFEGIITSWNAAAEKIYGYSAAEILGRSIALLRPPEIPDLMSTIMPRLKQGEMIDNFETIRLRKDGSRVHVSVSLSPIKSATGEITGISAISRDITERKRIEKALESAEGQYHSIFNNAVDGIFRTSPDGKFLVANPAAAHIFGFASPEELIEERQDIAQQGYVDPLRREEFKRLLQEQGVVNGFEYEGYRKDRSRVWISENTRAVHSPSGEILYFEGIFEDVTERKQAEEALRESEERFRTIFEQAPLGISEGEIATARFVNANQRYVAILGYTIDELRTLTFKDYTHPEDLQKDLVEFQKLAAGQIRTFAMEKRYIRKDGAIIWANLTVSALAPPGEEPLNCMAVIEDITERRQAEEALKESEQQMRLFMQATADCLWNWDLITGNVVRSVGFNRVFGYAVEDVDSSLTWWEERLHPDDRERVVSTFHDTIASGGNACSYEYRFRRKDGTLAVIHDRAHIVRDAKGKPLSALGAMTDITERKQAAKELEGANHQLRLLSRRLFQVQEDEKRHLARELHDEMGQALTAAKINLQSAQRVDNRSDLALRLDESIGILDRLLQQTRRLSFDLRPPLLDDLGLVPALRSYLDEQAQRAGFRATFFADPHLERLSPEIETACFRVAQQALTNAVRYAEARTVNVELRLAPHALHLIVRDDGRGFDVEAAEERARRGGSLGLPGMRERLSLVGGELDYKSTPGRGTEVHAFLPLEIDSHVSGVLS